MFSSVATIFIAAPPAVVWDALTNPVVIKQYLFGTEATSDWKVGSPISYKGSWEGKPYEDKGFILELIPEHLLVTSYFSGFFGETDVPEHYWRITYRLISKDDGTELSITSDNVPTQERADHSAKNWELVMATMKKILET